jgi:hypothetical protein
MNTLLTSITRPTARVLREALLARVGGSPAQPLARAAFIVGSLLPGVVMGLVARRRARLVRARLASAVAAVATGALAIGALSVGAVAISRLAVKSMRIGRLRIDELEIRRTIGGPAAVLPGSPTV